MLFLSLICNFINSPIKVGGLEMGNNYTNILEAVPYVLHKISPTKVQ